MGFFVLAANKSVMHNLPILIFIICNNVFTGFTKVYELSVNESTSLVHTGEGAESIMFLEPDFDFVTHATSSLKVKSIVDGVPEARSAWWSYFHFFIFHFGFKLLLKILEIL